MATRTKLTRVVEGRETAPPGRWTIDTGDEQRDAHLRSAEFLDVERYPHVLFRSTAVRPGDRDRWDVSSDLIRDVTRAVTLAVELCGATVDPRGNIRAGLVGTTEIDREDFDITWNQMLGLEVSWSAKGSRSSSTSRLCSSPNPTAE